jgi:hypothetical protein
LPFYVQTSVARGFLFLDYNKTSFCSKEGERTQEDSKDFPGRPANWCCGAVVLDGGNLDAFGHVHQHIAPFVGSLGYVYSLRPTKHVTMGCVPDKAIHV